jgi:hypothetical protein
VRSLIFPHGLLRFSAGSTERYTIGERVLAFNSRAHNLGGQLETQQFGATLLAFSISVIRASRVLQRRKTRFCCGSEQWNDVAHIRSNAA